MLMCVYFEQLQSERTVCLFKVVFRCLIFCVFAVLACARINKQSALGLANDGWLVSWVVCHVM